MSSDEEYFEYDDDDFDDNMNDDGESLFRACQKLGFVTILSLHRLRRRGTYHGATLGYGQLLTSAQTPCPILAPSQSFSIP